MTLYNVRLGPEQSDPFRQRAHLVAGEYLQAKMSVLGDMGPGKFMWIKTEPTSPSFADLVFSFRNKIFAVVAACVESGFGGNGEPSKLLSDKVKKNLMDVAKENDLFPCVFPIEGDGRYKPATNGWNLWDMEKREYIDPTKEADETKVEMSGWEIQSMAIQIVKESIENDGFAIESYQDVPGIDPQIWFSDKKGRHSYVVVRGCRYPEAQAEKPKNLYEFVRDLGQFHGYFASVGLASAESKILYRGEGTYVSYSGLKPLGEAVWLNGKQPGEAMSEGDARAN